MTIRNKPSRHVVVVGAGILGACIAWCISERGFPVTLIDKSDPGSGASSHSFAMINADAKYPLHYHNLNRRSQDMWTRFAAELARDGDGASLGLRWGGKLAWVSDADAAVRLEAHVRQMQSWGYPMRLLSESELSDMEPGLKVGSVAAAAYSENEGQVEPQLVIEACLHRLAERNCDVCRNTEVTGLRTDERGTRQGGQDHFRRHSLRCRCTGSRLRHHTAGLPVGRSCAAGDKLGGGDQDHAAAASAAACHRHLRAPHGGRGVRGAFSPVRGWWLHGGGRRPGNPC